MGRRELPVPEARIESCIFFLRGAKVMLSTHLAEVYQVEPKALKQAVKRNLKCFPEDFMLRLTWEEANLLRSKSVILKEQSEPFSRSQIVTLKRGRNVKYLPYAFTEQGIAMLSSVLRSDRAIHVNMSPENGNEAALSKYPKVSGYPHLFVLDKNGTLLHSQDTSKLEDGKSSYDLEKFTAFLTQWAPAGK